jgi:hypothetical protein
VVALPYGGYSHDPYQEGRDQRSYPNKGHPMKGDDWLYYLFALTIVVGALLLTEMINA